MEPWLWWSRGVAVLPCTPSGVHHSIAIHISGCIFSTLLCLPETLPSGHLNTLQGQHVFWRSLSTRRFSLLWRNPTLQMLWCPLVFCCAQDLGHCQLFGESVSRALMSRLVFRKMCPLMLSCSSSVVPFSSNYWKAECFGCGLETWDHDKLTGGLSPAILTA